MKTRNGKWGAALVVGLILVSGASIPVQGQDWNNCDNCQECPPKKKCGLLGWCKGCFGKKNDPCDDPCNECNGCRGLRKCRSCHDNCRCYKAVTPGYCDPRDTQLYSAQGFGVPVAVPQAPMVKTYNYGWGIPSSRLSQSPTYGRWYPDTWYSQNGGNLVGGQYPMVYQPTDTTQLGFYHTHVPRWQPWGTW